MDLAVTLRDLQATDLTDLDWSGGQEHIRAVAIALEAAYEGEVEVIVAELGNGLLVGLGAVDFRPDPAAGTIWMLSVHERLQSLGLGTAVIRDLEERVARRGLRAVRLLVEHDNPRAKALYERLGYVESGTAIDAWPVAGGRTYVTSCALLQREPDRVQGPEPVRG